MLRDDFADRLTRTLTNRSLSLLPPVGYCFPSLQLNNILQIL